MILKDINFCPFFIWHSLSLSLSRFEKIYHHHEDFFFFLNNLIIPVSNPFCGHTNDQKCIKFLSSQSKMINRLVMAIKTMMNHFFFFSWYPYIMTIIVWSTHQVLFFYLSKFLIKANDVFFSWFRKLHFQQ